MSARSQRTGLYEMPNEPGLPDLFRVRLRQAVLELNTHSIARVVASDLQPAGYDPITQRASVTVEVLQVVKDLITPPTRVKPNPTKLLKPTILKNIKVYHPGNTVGAYLTFPIVVGTTGELHVQDRSIEQWSRTGIPSDPVSAFVHVLQDSVFHPGVAPAANPITPPTSQAAAVLEGPLIDIGAAATLGTARLTDPVAAVTAMTTWATTVETAINAIAPGTFTPANSFLSTVAATMGTISGASVKVRTE